jgi:hypothetical protein
LPRAIRSKTEHRMQVAKSFQYNFFYILKPKSIKNLLFCENFVLKENTCRTLFSYKAGGHWENFNCRVLTFSHYYLCRYNILILQSVFFCFQFQCGLWPSDHSVSRARMLARRARSKLLHLEVEFAFKTTREITSPVRNVCLLERM